MMYHSHPTHEELEAVDVMPQEARHLNELQGGEEFTPHGYYMYRSLGSHLKHPHIQEYLSQSSHHRRMAAQGGAMHEESHMPHEMHEMTTVYMPRHMTHMLDHMIGGADISPHTGRRRYFLGSLVGNLRNAVGNAANKAGNFFSGTGNTLRNLVTTGNFGQMARNAAGQLGRNAVNFAGQMAGLPEDQRNLGGLGRAAGQMASGALNAGVEHAKNAISDPNFSFNKQNLANVGRGAFGAARDYTTNQMSNALSSPMDEMQSGGGNPYEGDNFASQFGNLGHQYGGQLGEQYGGQAGAAAGQMAGRGYTGAAGRIGANADQANDIAGNLQNRTNIYGRNTGRQLGSAVAGRAGQMFGKGLDRAHQYLNNRMAPQQGAMHPELMHGFSDDMFA